MKLPQVKKSVIACINARRVPIIEGPPGIGKTSIIYEIADELKGGNCRVRTLADMDPTDTCLPKILNNGGNIHTFTVADWLPQEGEGILFIDEFKQGIPSVQNVFSQLILERKIRDAYTLPDGWDIVLASNRDVDKAATHKMPRHIDNRLIHLEAEVCNDAWLIWALEHDIDTRAIFFIKHRPELLFSYDPKRHDRAFPSPRSWHAASDLIKTNPCESILYDLLAGTYGEGTAAEFTGFLKIFKTLVSPDLVISSPATADVPSDPATLYALCAALCRKATDNTIGRLITYAKRLPREYEMLLIHSAKRHNPAICNTREMAQWESDNVDINT